MLLVMIIMKNESNKLFTANLIKLYQQMGYNSVNDMATDFCIPVGTLKCWISGNRSPKLASMNDIANKLGCYAFNLIKADGNFENLGIHNNNVHKAFTQQLQIAFINRQAKSYLNKLYLLDNVISYDTLVSYLRPVNYRLPTLRTLDQIADALNINSYELIKEEV